MRRHVWTLTRQDIMKTAFQSLVLCPLLGLAFIAAIIILHNLTH